MKRNNVAVVGTKHNITNCYRAAINKQKGPEVNYIIVTCEPSRNGIYRWDATKAPMLSIWNNKSTPCYCVPEEMLEYVQSLESVKTPDIQEAIVKSQKEFCKTYRKKPVDWLTKF